MIQPDYVIRSNRKTLSVRIDPFGKITVRAPKHCAKERILSFLQEKEGWIEKHLEKIKGAGMRLPPENLDKYSFLLLGKQTEISLWESKKIAFDKENGRLFLPKEKTRETLVKWLKENAKRIFSQATEERALQMCVQVKSVSITGAKTRWGSCSGVNAIHYSFRLLYAPKEVVEYVIVHELAHVRHKNHSKNFWAEVEKYIPEWKVRRAWLKDHAYLMGIF